MPIQSEVDSQGRAVINGLEGPGSFLVDLSFRYQIPLEGSREPRPLLRHLQRVESREPGSADRQPLANLFMVPTAAQFPRQMQFGVRVRF